MKRKTLTLWGLSILGALTLASPGGQAGDFLSFGSSARSIGMGRAFVALANDSSAVYTNPAAMVQIPTIEGSFFQSNLYDVYQLTAFNLVLPMVDNHIGLSFVQLASSAMDGRDEDNLQTGSFTDSKSAISVAYATPLFLPNLSVGVSAKYVVRTLADNTDARVLGDLSALYRPFSFLSIGATVQNLLDYQLDHFSADKFKPSIRVGIAYRDKDFALSYDIENDLNTWFLGMEYRLHPLLALRGGINYESVNAGFSSEIAGLRFDYAYSNNELGATSRFSINLGIGQIINDFQRNVASDWHASGTDKYREGFFLLALEDMKKAYILNPNDEDIIKKLGKLKKLEQLSDKLSLNINTERALWPDYLRLKQLIESGQGEKAFPEIKALLQKYPDNPNLLHLIDLSTKTGTSQDKIK